MKIEIKIWRPLLEAHHFIFRHIEGKIETEVYDGFYYTTGEILPLKTFKHGVSETSKNIIRRVYKK
jgi:hypothetical protein